MEIKSKPSFFNKGMTSAHFQQSGKLPVDNDLFTIAVIGLIGMSMHLFSNSVGIGSRQQDLFGDFTIMSMISCRESSLNFLNVGTLYKTSFQHKSMTTTLNYSVIHFHGQKVKLLKENYMFLSNFRAIISNPLQKQCC